MARGEGFGSIAQVRGCKNLRWGGGRLLPEIPVTHLTHVAVTSPYPRYRNRPSPSIILPKRGTAAQPEFGPSIAGLHTVSWSAGNVVLPTVHEQ